MILGGLLVRGSGRWEKVWREAWMEVAGGEGWEIEGVAQQRRR